MLALRLLKASNADELVKLIGLPPATARMYELKTTLFKRMTRAMDSDHSPSLSVIARRTGLTKSRIRAIIRNRGLDASTDELFLILFGLRCRLTVKTLQLSSTDQERA